jgi:hypothetical protein
VRMLPMKRFQDKGRSHGGRIQKYCK